MKPTISSLALIALVSLPPSLMGQAPNPQQSKKERLDALEKRVLSEGVKLGLPNGYQEVHIGVNQASDKTFVLQGDTQVPLPSHEVRVFGRTTVSSEVAWTGLALPGAASTTVAPSNLKTIKVPGVDVNFMGAGAVLVKLIPGKYVGTTGMVERWAVIPRDRPALKGLGDALMEQATYNDDLGQTVITQGVGDSAAGSPYSYDQAHWFGELIILEKPLPPGHFAVVMPMENQIWDFDVVQ